MKAAKADFKVRLGAVVERLEGLGISALFVTDSANVRYLSGFTGSNGALLISKKGAWLFTDSRYTEQAKAEVPKAFKIRICKGPLLDELAKIALQGGSSRAGFEADDLSHSAYLRLKKSMSATRLKPISGVVEAIRRVKDSSEIALIEKAVSILDDGFSLVRRTLKAGVTEDYVAQKVERLFKESGAEGAAFDLIVASGWRGALPHGKASGKVVRKGDFVVVDMGARYAGYNSDGTRTYSIGAPSRTNRKIYDIVLGAQLKALEAIKDGVGAKAIDSAARDYIAKAGYAKAFGHGTGHGIGLKVHEGPSLGPKSADVLIEGMVVTIEPGIYVPGACGVRIEDMALVQRDGARILTKTPKELICL